MIDAAAAAARLREAFDARRPIAPPSADDRSFDLAAAYAVERELARMRRDAGHHTVGRKVGYANKAVWRVMKLDTLVWASMYDDTVRFAPSGQAALSTAAMIAPKIEPEIVFKLKSPIAADAADPAAILSAVEWLALGFEIIDCPYPDWKFQPVDFVAARGLHAALVVGPERTIAAGDIPALAEQLPKFKVKLSRNGELVEEGSGRNSLRSPALCLGELASAIAKRTDQAPLAAGELVSTGTLTESQPMKAGETWRAEVDGIDLQPLTLALQG
ncbi:MAG TPA: fumarylacetoacetate hydrolase family protein [Vicinamibacterales bacterium]|nr:fumarylacetoacetate hydrolase family protein [Vicinamibacterales bacterium]